MRDRNLDLDIGPAPGTEASGKVARVYVALASGILRDGGAPAITAACRSHRELAAEVERLKGELDAALERAREHFGAEPPAGGPEPVQAAPVPSAPRELARVGEGMRVRDLMTREVRTLRRNDRLSAAEELMKVGRFRHVVVLDEDDEVAGVLSQRSIFHGALAWSLGQGARAHRKALEAFSVKDVMETEVVTVEPDRPLREAAETMIERKIGCLPVVEANRLVGILTEGDFLAKLTGS